jgi:uroporphyrinogen-III synthase
MAKYKVLSTKKLDPLLIEKAKKDDIEIVEQEAIKIISVLSREKWQEIFQVIEDKKEFVVFTSSNAVFALQKYLNDYTNPHPINWKIFSLSGKTKQSLENCTEFGTIIDTADNSTELAEKIVKSNINKVVFFCGDKRRDELPAILNATGISVHEIVVYDTVETPVRAETDIDAVLFFSPSAVTSFFSINQLIDTVVCFAIGETTANSIADHTNNKILISKKSSQESLLQEVINYFKRMVGHS